MHILITGGTGFIGSELIKHLTGHQLTIVTRQPAQAKLALKHTDFSNIQYIANLAHYSDLNHIDAVINLCGEPIAAQRWTEEQKHKITHSRLAITQQLNQLFKASDTPPQCLISASAIGIYGDTKDQRIDEQQPINEHGFAAQLCAQWESYANDLAPITRVCILRFASVLDLNGGLLKALLPIYRLGLGCKIGQGQQYLSWVHRLDAIRAMLFLLESTHLKGDFNISAPHPLPQKDFSLALARTLNRPQLGYNPNWLIKLIMGESSQLLLESTRAKPTKLTEAGFVFQFSRLELALKQILQKH